MFLSSVIALIELIIIGGIVAAIAAVGYFAYTYFLSSWLKARKESNLVANSHFVGAEKIASIKLTSHDPKDIEHFLQDNAAFLSDKMTKALLARIDSLQTDHFIADDDATKMRDASVNKRIAALETEPMVEEVTHGQTARS